MKVHTPPEHTRSRSHARPQTPQLRESVVRFTQVRPASALPQRVSAVAHVGTQPPF
jgi:hypothetical protein